MLDILVLAVLVFPKIASVVLVGGFAWTERVRDASRSILYESRMHLSLVTAREHQSRSLSRKLAGGPRLAQLALQTQSPARSPIII